jgi:D-glycero-alpha-D-manno-heptose-7-phosphate kinase
VRSVIARAPTRIDFGGGWTDVPPYTTEQGGCVCNLAISRCSLVAMQRSDSGVMIDDEGEIQRAESVDALPRTGAELAKAALRRAQIGAVAVELRNDFPRGAGLGGSSAAGVAMQAALAAWREERVVRVELAERSRALEVNELAIPGGSQDHYAAALGGALGLWFTDRVSTRRIPLSASLVEEIERRFVVVFTGQSRISGRTITAVIDAYRQGVPRVRQALTRMRELAEQMIVALERGSLDELAGLVAEHWEHQRELHPTISTPGIEQVLERGRSAGALGGKALGASGGGSVLVIAPEDRVTEVRAAVSRVAEPLPFSVDVEGVSVSVQG